ncbi:hypothetical protein H4219_006447 [Mycoemilia scoparia]|uniref:Uncharacterized protein n=1 Tax=Mycoemilia scoparia TaxID=417184 RepID=A0A9W7ZH98_9FUNG|nr:hypothetical protein H4219_006447 [Mycoemilia scoparia]
MRPKDVALEVIFLIDLMLSWSEEHASIFWELFDFCSGENLVDEVDDEPNNSNSDEGIGSTGSDHVELQENGSDGTDASSSDEGPVNSESDHEESDGNVIDISSSDAGVVNMQVVFYEGHIFVITHNSNNPDQLRIEIL